MDDSKIIDLYWRRDERAIEETDSKYRLGYIIDDRCNNAECAYLYCIRDTGGQLSACYIQVAGD